MALATVEQFEERHGPADDFVEPLLEDASALILDEVSGSEETWVTDEEEAVPAKVVAVCVAVAFRAWRNPEALSQEALGAHSMAWRQTAEEALYLTDRERRTVRRAAGRGSFTAQTMESPYSGDVEDSLDFDSDAL